MDTGTIELSVMPLSHHFLQFSVSAFDNGIPQCPRVNVPVTITIQRDTGVPFCTPNADERDIDETIQNNTRVYSFSAFDNDLQVSEVCVV